MINTIDTISVFANQWLGTALPKLFLLFLCILLCILVVAAVWDRKIKTLGASFGISLCIFLFAIVFGDSVASVFGGLDVTIRMRLVAVLVSVAMLLLTVVTFVTSALRLRYGVLWGAISLLVLLTALFPGPLQLFPSVIGLQYGSAIAALGILFLLLLGFHLSVVVSGLQDRQQYLLKRVYLLEQEIFDTAKSDYPNPTFNKNSLYDTLLGKISGHNVLHSFSWRVPHGTALTAPVIILMVVVAVTLVGMLSPQAMVGDEVTHYYMMQTQSQNLLVPNFFAEIPTGWGDVEVRRYPHSFLWHYLGAVLFYFSGGSFFVIQLYQALFLAQLLSVAYLLARSRGGVETRSALVYLLLIASLPMSLIFSVAFYQDVPMTAQVLTAFYLLRKDRWVLATLFLCFALGLKVTAILFFPAFFLCILFWTFRRETLFKTILVLSCSLMIVTGFTFGFSKILKQYGRATFYPAVKMEQIIKQVAKQFDQGKQVVVKGDSVNSSDLLQKSIEPVVSEQMAEVIANHPGDLRVKTNFLVYGGLLLYLAIASAVITATWQCFGGPLLRLPKEGSFWLWGTGVSYLVLVFWFLRSAPDARFFLPGLIFCMMPMAERVVCLPWQRWIAILITTLAIMQSGYALAKTYHLREVNPDIQGAIQFLRENPPKPSRIFMYPEGNYRLFPVPHTWYLKYSIREFWRSENDKRVQMLHSHGVGAIVIKKYLVSTVDENITNLGVYPSWFVDEIGMDDQFTKLYENAGVVIYDVP